MHKPLGVVSTAHDPEGRPKVTDLVRSSARLYPVGRLDVDSSGLILLTNDGELANRLTHPQLRGREGLPGAACGARSPTEALEQLRQGVELEDGATAPADVTEVSSVAPRRRCSRSSSTKGASARCGGCARRWGTA